MRGARWVGLAYDAYEFALLLTCLALVATVGVALRLVDAVLGTRLLDGLLWLFDRVGGG